MARRQHLTLMVILAVLAFFSLTWLMGGSESDNTQLMYAPAPQSAPKEKAGEASTTTAGETDSSSSSGAGTGQAKGGAIADFGVVPANILSGGAIAPKLENKTIKAELGRASWKLLHTMMARFPDQPTSEDSLALKTYVQLFARLYPCGDCAAHFQKLLARYPPQTSSRNAAAGWACFVHNEVNKRLGKQLFDCNNIGDFYDCGCGEEGKDGKKEGGAGASAGREKTTEGAGELKERERQKSTSAARSPLELEKEGLTRGG